MDGVITDGKSSVDEAAITGESKPVSKSVDDEVIAGTGNQDGSLTVKVAKSVKTQHSLELCVLSLRLKAQKSNVQVLADKAAFSLTIIAIATAVITFLFTGYSLKIRLSHLNAR